jgi:hypothetical protein
MITVISSGESPDHGHPRAHFLGSIGRHSSGPEPLIFSTELAALFVDAQDPDALANSDADVDVHDLAFDDDGAVPLDPHQRFKKILPGIINVRSDGRHLYAYRRVQQGYQWEAYGPIEALP